MSAESTQLDAPSERPSLPPRVHHAPRPGRRRGHQTSPRERQAVVAVAVLAGVVALFSPAQPTNYLLTDLVVRAGVAVLVTLATSRARRWTWLVVAGLAAVGAPSGTWTIVCGAGLVFAFVTTLFARRRISGAIVGAFAAQGLVRFTDAGVGRVSALLWLVAVGSVCASAYAVSPRRVRKQIHRGLVAAGAVVALGVVVFAVSSALAFGPSQAGAKQAKSGLAAVRDGRSEQGVTSLQEATDSFTTANDRVSSWWAAPAGAVPLLAQQVHAVQVVTEEGAALSGAAAHTARQTDIQQLKYQDGRIDVARLAALAPSLRTTADALDHAEGAIQSVRSPWLVGPLGTRLDDVDAEVRAAQPQLHLAADAAESGPALLGADSPKRYLVLFTQPAEARGLGGFMGNWVELTAVDGRLDITRSGRASDLNDTPGRDSRVLRNPPVPQDYIDRYTRFRPGTYVQDVTLSPDLPSVAAAMRQLYPEMGGAPIDGVLTVDPYALAALLTFTGPIRVPGYDQPLTAQNAAQVLVQDQYTQLGNDSRKDFLDQASRQTFDALVHGSLPSPAKVGEVLGPMVEQRHLMFTPFDARARSLFERIHASGSFDAPTTGDFFQLVTQNSANNKIDLYLHRDVDYRSTFDPATGETDSVATITLRNDAPTSGLPPSVIGSNDQGLPSGTNRLYLSFYTPLGLRSAKLGADATPLEYQRELGMAVYSRYLTIPSGSSVTLELTLHGTLAPTDTYQLRVGHQPLVNPDAVRVHLGLTGAWEIDRAPTWIVEPSRSSAATARQPTAPIDLVAELRRS